ncbi:MAG: YebC/PmpR family DNA-binding transcriptional regulator [Candidatus Komeilibacteria bacterium]
MSGHSKWATTKRQKASADAKRSNLFTKLAKNIAIAARDGSDPETNFKLRIAIDRAKKLSLPKDNIERAIKNGSGELTGQQIEEILYEAYAPDGIALLIATITDNKNRTVSEIKHLLTKAGGSLGSSGSVLWMFTRRGVIYLNDSNLKEEQELALIDAGAIDIDRNEDKIIIYTSDTDFKAVEEVARNAKLDIDDSDLEYIAKDIVVPPQPDKITKLMDQLDELDDVQNVYTNADV